MGDNIGYYPPHKERKDKMKNFYITYYSQKDKKTIPKALIFDFSIALEIAVEPSL